MTTERKRVFSGIQPSGEVHLGNYLGAIKNWVDLTEDYECIYCIVDLHAITIPYQVDELPERVFDVAVSLVASGLEPDRCTLFVQSHVPEHAELQWLFNTVTPLGDLGRMTQFKDKSERVESVSAGLLNYPVLQAADILLYLAEYVPVGEDQRQHLELTRPEPDALIIGPGRRVLGLDGVAKMSKSRDNVIPLLATPEELESIIRTAVTDPARKRRDDPGNPHVCNIFSLHGAFSTTAEREEIEARCQTAQIGCVDCKLKLAGNIAETIAPIRERADELRAKPKLIREILADGAERARAIAAPVMAEVYDLMGLRRVGSG
jgi:tryptophanyl-tRNA synthetase